MSDLQEGFDDFLSEVQAKYKSIKLLRADKDNLKSLYERRDLLKNDINNLTASIENMLKKAEIISSDIADELQGSGKAASLLLKSLKMALKVNKEYDHKFFKAGLRRACEDPRTIALTGFKNGTLKVSIRLNETAGSISDYSNAVRSVRKMHGNRRNIKNLSPQEELDELAMRDKFWEEKFYGPAREGKTISRRKFNKKTGEYEKVDVTSRQVKKYWDTMRARLEQSGKPAPFWEIIDKGSVAMPGKGGTAYPYNEPTNFVGTAIALIQKEYKKKYAIQRREIDTQVKETKQIKAPLVQQLQELNAYIASAKLGTERTVYNIDAELAFYARVKGLSERSERPYSKEKMNRVLAALRAGDISGLSITAEGRIELTARGEKRFRVSISRIITEFGL